MPDENPIIHEPIEPPKPDLKQTTPPPSPSPTPTPPPQKQ